MEEEEEIKEEASEEEGNMEPDLTPKAAEFFAVSKNFDRHGSVREYRTGPSYRCDGRSRWIEVRKCNNPRNGHAI